MAQNRETRRKAAALQRRGIASAPELQREPTHERAEKILTTREAADFCRLSKPTLERFRITGHGPTYLKLGGAVRYRQLDLDDWLESRLTKSTSEEP